VTRLTRTALGALPAAIGRPAPADPDNRIGIVHFGPGAFHRAHQAAYIDRLLAADPRWGIAAVALRSRATIDALASQDGLYTLAIRDSEPAMRVIGAHRRFLGPGDEAAIAALLTRPDVALVTATVTEKGYCLSGDGHLDLAHPDIVHDLTPGAVPRSFIGWVVAGLAARRAAGIAPFRVMPCDNMADNGGKLHRALVAFADARDRDLAAWIAGAVRVPATMVDAITPASDAALLADVAAATGLTDAAPVQREAFAQWVIEDDGARDGPDLVAAGAIVTHDVGGWERAKLRILNGAHSTLAYGGLLRGHESVAAAMADPELGALVEALVREDVAPVLPPVAGLDLDAYRAAVFARFRNPAIVHRLEQIAQDGSQKIPYRLLDTVIANLDRGHMPYHALRAVAAWIAFLIDRTRRAVPVIDPLATPLLRACASGDPAHAVRGLLALDAVFPARLREAPDVVTALTNNVNFWLSGQA